MSRPIVVDIGNTRIKWGLCSPIPGPIEAVASLPDDPTAWETQMLAWGLTGQCHWTLASVQPARSQHLRTWLEERGQAVRVLKSAQDLPLRVKLEYPDRAGIDRLLDAVAARSRTPEGTGAVLVDAGSAVTVDWLDEEQAFAGGSIFPGLRLMAEALHNYTAMLPLVQVAEPIPALPAVSTRTAMEAGIFHAVAGGVREIARRLSESATRPPRIFFTGGDAPLLFSHLEPLIGGILWPEMTLEGIRLSDGGLS